MPRVIRSLLFIALVGIGAAWWLTRPSQLDVALFEGLAGQPERGESVFWAAGCASCHTAPKAEAGDRPVLAGGQGFPSDFGTFRAPNISTDTAHGIGGWSLIDFANAIQNGVSPDGEHYYPAFPYTAYAKLEPQDVADLWSFVQTLPADATPSQPHAVGFPFNVRRSLGGWKLLFADGGWVVDDAPTPDIQRGRYLVEALGHCGECHTPRNPLGGLKRAQWLSGAPVPGGKGRVPGIDPANLDWAESDILYYFETGFTPDFDSAGGHMAEVVKNLARLTPEDRGAIVAYLKALP